jgi:hypothetical protein
MLARWIFAGIAVVAVAVWPRSPRWAAVALGAGAASAAVAGVAVARDTLVSVGPMLAFLTVALGVAGWPSALASRNERPDGSREPAEEAPVGSTRSFAPPRRFSPASSLWTARSC